ncbi:uncharacterized protein EV422DRAFT_66348 [Fimicolochytrium jonesii]|uniref:uncharacterized protein n=1 Tax=Fimicolochytrium jonesii TaxID=1396493 RepID=UPI0022FEEFA0|nr:uncharacterized protein EV422DRAFT_66348 [Fimicolochytrium jonesii]KAI8820856.1 hypothetical protein EV422DRAFT_66348 [Fimicolochytrium jonesii]
MSQASRFGFQAHLAAPAFKTYLDSLWPNTGRLEELRQEHLLRTGHGKKRQEQTAKSNRVHKQKEVQIELSASRLTRTALLQSLQKGLIDENLLKASLRASDSGTMDETRARRRPTPEAPLDEERPPTLSGTASRDSQHSNDSVDSSAYTPDGQPEKRKRRRTMTVNESALQILNEALTTTERKARLFAANNCGVFNRRDRKGFTDEHGCERYDTTDLQCLCNLFLDYEYQLPWHRNRVPPAVYTPKNLLFLMKDIRAAGAHSKSINRQRALMLIAQMKEFLMMLDADAAEIDQLWSDAEALDPVEGNSRGAQSPRARCRKLEPFADPNILKAFADAVVERLNEERKETHGDLPKPSKKSKLAKD